MMRAAIFAIDTGAYKAKAESAAATALKRLLEQAGFEVLETTYQGEWAAVTARKGRDRR